MRCSGKAGDSIYLQSRVRVLEIYGVLFSKDSDGFYRPRNVRTELYPVKGATLDADIRCAVDSNSEYR